jgi:hypothetical protein
MIAAFAEKAVGASVVLEPRIASSKVASSTLPAAVVEAAGTSCCTKAVVATAVVLLPEVCVTAVVPVGREGVPVKAGLARSALFAALAIVK